MQVVGHFMYLLGGIIFLGGLLSLLFSSEFMITLSWNFFSVAAIGGVFTLISALNSRKNNLIFSSYFLNLKKQFKGVFLPVYIIKGIGNKGFLKKVSGYRGREEKD